MSTSDANDILQEKDAQIAALRQNNETLADMLDEANKRLENAQIVQQRNREQKDLISRQKTEITHLKEGMATATASADKANAENGRLQEVVKHLNQVIGLMTFTDR